jgi:TPR repeat protein
MTRRQKKLDRWRRDAERGEIWPAEWLGSHYYKLADKRRAYSRLRYGTGKEDDKALLREILKYTTMAAERGSARSQMRLALIYADGLAGERNKSKARSLLESAAMSNGSYTAVDCIELMKEGKTLEEAIEIKRISVE